MTTYATPQNADLHRLRQKSALIQNPIKTCEASLLQMSGAPFQQWKYISDGRYTNARTYTSDDDDQRQITVSSPPYLAQEPHRFLLPLTQSYEPTMMQTASSPRFPAQGRAWDNGSDSKYKFSPTTTGSLAQYSIQRPSVSRQVEYAGPSSLYCDASSRSRGSVGSVGRINDVDSQYSSSSATFPSPVHSDQSPVIYSTMPAPSGYQQPPIHQRHSTASMPSGFENLLHHPTPSPPPPRTSTTSRYRLFIRQQPIAARACGAGDRDRRPVDPPPIVQMLLTEFNPGSEEDKSILQDPRFTVGCLLYPVQNPSWVVGASNAKGRQEGTNLDLDLEDSNAPGQSTPLLSGKSFVSPFYVEEEPDPDTAPPHPSVEDHSIGSEPVRALARKPRAGPGPNPPASFFIFSDLSVRTPGLYRLQFRFMNWGSVEDTGQSMPILAEVWSDPFHVYPAKSFPGMLDSSFLTVRLKELGFVELKMRGKGKGKGRRAEKGNLRAHQD